MDSIRENRTKEDILAEIRMERAADIYDEKCFILVEGSDDALFTNKMFQDNVICLESFAGKSGLMELIAEDAALSDNVIGIRDKDYADESSLPERIFLYDHCCLEMMMLSEPAVAESFFHIYYKGTIPCNAFIANAMRQLSSYSILRRKNEKESLKINFRKVNFGDLVDFSNESLDDRALFQRAGKSETYDSCRQEAESLDDTDLWEITNGHDICTFLGRLSKNGKTDMSETGVRNVLLVSHRKDDFAKTNLFQSILSYQQQKHLTFLESSGQRTIS